MCENSETEVAYNPVDENLNMSNSAEMVSNIKVFKTFTTLIH